MEETGFLPNGSIGLSRNLPLALSLSPKISNSLRFIAVPFASGYSPALEPQPASPSPPDFW